MEARTVCAVLPSGRREPRSEDLVPLSHPLERVRKRAARSAEVRGGTARVSKHVYDFPRPMVTVDCVVFGLDERDLKVLLIERGVEPLKGRWALPGGFARLDESLDDAALRELKEEAGVSHVFLEQLYTFGEPERDPRGRVITVAYYALVKLSDHRVRATTDASEAAWFSVWDTPRLAFDHDEILRVALRRFKGKVRYH